MTMLLFLAMGFVPAAGLLAATALRTPRAILAAVLVTVLADAGVVGVVVARVFRSGPMQSGIFYADALSGFHLAVMMLVFVLTSLYALPYFAHAYHFERRDAVRYAALWLGSLVAMTLVLVSNNLGLMWVGVEATTLLTALLIYVHRTPASLEAMWKYILICSVGVAFAFMGTLLVAAAGRKASDALVWTSLRDAAGSLDADTLKMAFLFLLVGYGTKTGLAPMHSWLPDAHSQAPAPVSGLFSGFMLSTALYCIMRYVPLVEAATGRSGWSLKLLVLFGLISIVVAASFIVAQRDIKRLLAYSSVEHLGIVALGVGLGGLGTFAALFHTLNHALGKSLAFFSAGRLGQAYGTHEMDRMNGAIRVSPLWGAGLLGSLLALVGAAPFALFMSEFQILKAAAEGRAIWTLVLFLAGVGVVFIGALRHVIAIVWGEDRSGARAQPVRLFEGALVVLPMAALLVLGLWMPAPLRTALQQAAAVVGGAP